MNVVYIMPGTGGMFYCQNCERDYFLVKALEHNGHTVTVVPLYLPYMQGGRVLWEGTPIFYGALNVYLETLVPPYRYVPRFLKRVMDCLCLLKLVARKSGTLSARGLEKMTLAMMRSADVGRTVEFRRMVRWLQSGPRPDVIHVSDTLLCGLVRPLKEAFGVPVVCSVQDEHVWILSMRARYIDRVWRTMEEECAHADALLSVSEYYTAYLRQHISVRDGVLRTIPLGVPVAGQAPERTPPDPPVLGFMSRLSHALGLELLVDAFIMLHGDPGFADLRLHLTGGHAGEDLPFLKKMLARLDNAGLGHLVRVIPTPTHGDRASFLRSLSVLCVPAYEPMAFSLFQLEALAVGVPVVVSEHGGMPELAAATGGAVAFEPYTARACADALAPLLADPAAAGRLAREGRDRVCSLNSDLRMASDVENVYTELITATAGRAAGA